MKFYLAAPNVMREEAKTITAALEANGWSCTHKWWEAWSPENLDKQAAQDLQGVLSADALFCITSGQVSCGMMFEVGAALAANKPVYVITSCTPILQFPQYFSLNHPAIRIYYADTWSNDLDWASLVFISFVDLYYPNKTRKK